MSSESRAPQEFEKSIVEQRALLMRVALKRCHNQADAEDLVQKTLMKALNSWQGFKPGTNLQAWLTTILHNQFLFQLRNKYVKDRGDGPKGFLEDRLVSTGANQDSGLSLSSIFQAVEQLQPDFREAISFLIMGLNMEEIANIWQVREGTVKSRINRARNKLASDGIVTFSSIHSCLTTYGTQTLVLASHPV